jgi:hypothetical protein
MAYRPSPVPKNTKKKGGKKLPLLIVDQRPIKICANLRLNQPAESSQVLRRHYDSKAVHCFFFQQTLA